VNRRLLAAAAAAVLLAPVAGCGIPTETEVHVEGSVPTPLAGAGDGSGSEPPGRLASEDPGQFVLNYLQAAAGETTGAYDRVKRFIVEDDRAELRERQGDDVAVTVVRVADEVPPYVDDGDGNSRVTVAVQQVGVLRPDGVLDPPVPGGPDHYTFTVGRVSSGTGKAQPGLYLLHPPDALLMSTEALRLYYLNWPVYFWSVDRTTLIADRRYLPVAVPAARRATEVIGWLTGGPADWLRRTARPLPEGSKVTGNVVQAENRLEVPLSGPGGSLDDESELELLATQIAWSLPELQGQLELRVRNQSRKVVDAAERRRTVLAGAFDDVPQRFCVYQGQVWSLSGPDQPAPAVPIAPEANRSVLAAGLARSGRNVAAALVSPVGDRRRLLAGIGAGLVGGLAASTGTYASMGRPVWLRGSDPAGPVGLVVADGKLYRFDTAARLSPVSLPDVPGPVVAVAAALDGRRIAVVAGGSLYVAGLILDDGAVALGPARRLPIPVTSPTAVDWIGAESLLVAGEGTGRRTVIQGVSVDGVPEKDALWQTGAPVTQLAAYPRGWVMFEAGGVSWSDRTVIRPDQLGGLAGPAAGTGRPTAPFFLH
jgi:hypothetical protein